MRAIAVLAISAGVGLCSAAEAQSAVDHTVAVGTHYQSFSFGKDGDVETASLVLVPITFQTRLNSRAALDGYAAYASGAITGNGHRFTLNGPVDSWVRLRWAANSWAVVAVGVALPTGVASHTGTEAAVSNALASDLLGFREASWGGAASGTFGLSMAHRVGGARFTFGSSYRIAGSFQPSVDTAMRYAPGDEVRIRAALERSFAKGNLTFGATLQRFSVDKADQRNLFQSGNRLRADASFSSRTWGLYIADLLRDKGDLTIPIINGLDGSRLRDTLVAVGWQNLAIAGASRTLRIASKLIVIPSVDVKIRTREDAGGNGWLSSGGIVVPFVAGGNELFPTVKVSYGSIVSSTRTSFAQKVVGLEVGLVMRRAFLRR